MYNKFYKGFCKVEECLVGLGFVLIVLLTFSNAILRVFNMPIVQSDDICMLLFSWTAFMGADVALRYSRLVGMDLVVKKFPPKVQKIISIFVFIVMIIIMAILVQGGMNIIKINGARSFNTLPIPFAAVTSSLPICGVLIIFTCLNKIFLLCKNFNNDEYDIKKDVPMPIGEELTGLDEEPVSLDDNTNLNTH